jgi:hypothetical protein
LKKEKNYKEQHRLDVVIMGREEGALSELWYQIVEGAKRDSWGFVALGILFILTGLNWIVYRSWWIDQASKTWISNKALLIIMMPLMGAFTVVIGSSMILMAFVMNSR